VSVLRVCSMVPSFSYTAHNIAQDAAVVKGVAYSVGDSKRCQPFGDATFGSQMPSNVHLGVTIIVHALMQLNKAQCISEIHFFIHSIL